MKIEHICKECKKVNKPYNGLTLCDDCWLKAFSKYERNKIIKSLKGK